MSTASERTAWLKISLIVMLAALALGTRLPAPWRIEVINDEMFHLKSWRSRYRTSDMLPLFIRRLDHSQRFSPAVKVRLKDWYYSSPPFQRLLCAWSDYSSCGYSLLAETIEALSKSDLTAVRVPSVLASLATVLLAYGLGKALNDDALGFLLAAFFTISLLSQVYAGIGRVHGLSQCALVGLLYMLVLDHRQEAPSPRRFLTVALLAQTTQLTTWGVIGILVLGELVHRYLRGTSLRKLIQQTWWYALLSTMLLGAILTAFLGTSIVGANIYSPGLSTWWENICLGSPFGSLVVFGTAGLWVSGLLWIALFGIGIRVLFAPGSPYRDYRWPFLAAIVLFLVVPLFASSNVRYHLIYGVIPVIVAAIGARSLFPAPRAALGGVVCLLAVFTPLSFFGQDYTYKYIFPAEIPYSPVARRLAKEMSPGDIWISWPYFACCPLYPYADLPEPIMPITGEEFQEALRNRPAGHACFVWMNKVDEGSHPALKRAVERVEYPNGMILLKLPPQQEHADGS